MTAPLPISAVIITKNAGPAFVDCLQALAFCAEILVVDSGSDDDTIAIARQHGARVIETHWRGYGPQKQFAVDNAAHDWVLCVDADEVVSAELRAALLAADRNGPVRAYEFPRCNRFLGRYLQHGEGYPDLSLRFFDRRTAKWSDDPVHEKVVPAGPVGLLAGDLLHNSAESLASYLDKQNRYTTLAAKAAIAQGKRVGAVRIVLAPIIRFIKFYILRLGFLDGLPGLVHILIGCHNSFLKYAKMIEIQRVTKQ